MSSTAEYHAWWDMVDRCTNENHKSFAYYGGRGITVCSEWKTDFVKFLNDVGKKPFIKAQLDRVDNNKGYSIDNVRWVTPHVNNINKRNSWVYVIKGVVHQSIVDAAKFNNVSVGTIKNWVFGYNVKYKRSDCYVESKYTS